LPEQRATFSAAFASVFCIYFLLMPEFISRSPEDLLQIAAKVKAAFPGNNLYILFGDLGSGKTTFVRAFCADSGLPDLVNSPTFAIVNEYGAQQKIFHFDLYRLKNTFELLEIGFEDYLDQKDAIIFIEWPEIAISLLPEEYVSLHFQVNKDNSRTIFGEVIKNN
jgi:tRNA threonylcarbamoyladenosine biosynthesis protein TsaE